MLTAKQETFCQEYLIDLNATQAAIRAGYSESTATEQGSRLLTNVNIHARIAELKTARSEKTLVDAEYVLLGLKEVAERCMQRKPVMEFNGKFMAQAKDAEGKDVWQFDSHGANKSLELLGKHVGVFEKDNTQKKTDGIAPEIILSIADKINKL